MTKEQLTERLVTAINKVDAAHSRLDKIEKDIQIQLGDISKELKTVTAWMNKGKGWAAAALLMAGLAGSAISKLIFK